MNYITKEKQKPAGFFIRFFALLIDLLIFISFGISLSLICIDQTKSIINITNDKSFEIYLLSKKDYLYYVWLVSILLMLNIEFLFIPLVTKGKTIGQLITKLEIVPNDDEKIIKKTFRRWVLGGFIWSVIIIFFIAFVPPETINKALIFNYVKNHGNDFKNIPKKDLNEFIEKYKWNAWEQASITIPASFSSISIIIQTLFLISIGANNKKIGIVDKITDVNVVYKNIKIFIKCKEILIIKPEKINENEIIWKN